MKFTFNPPVAGSVISISGRSVKAGEQVDLDEAAALRIVRTLGSASLVPADGGPPLIDEPPAPPPGETPEESAARKAKRKARKEAARVSPGAVPPEPSDEGGEPA